MDCIARARTHKTSHRLKVFGRSSNIGVILGEEYLQGWAW